jgi:hypothetical protein
VCMLLRLNGRSQVPYSLLLYVASLVQGIAIVLVAYLEAVCQVANTTTIAISMRHNYHLLDR